MTASSVRLEVKIVLIAELICVLWIDVCDDRIIGELSLAYVQRRWVLDVRAYALRYILLWLDKELGEVAFLSSW